jgi:hypothetical protein
MWASVCAALSRSKPMVEQPVPRPAQVPVAQPQQHQRQQRPGEIAQAESRYSSRSSRDGPCMGPALDEHGLELLTLLRRQHLADGVVLAFANLPQFILQPGDDRLLLRDGGTVLGQSRSPQLAALAIEHLALGAEGAPVLGLHGFDATRLFHAQRKRGVQRLVCGGGLQQYRQQAEAVIRMMQMRMVASVKVEGERQCQGVAPRESFSASKEVLMR